ncbi:Lon protease C-terminal proteolytic domain-containing protein [Pelagophyceae sp. CCMP2097]|nr:Lon protease C-terminal proteolytic domain-containing protein [Pelagophyceae sp. CCMP2097]
MLRGAARCVVLRPHAARPALRVACGAVSVPYRGFFGFGSRGGGNNDDDGPDGKKKKPTLSDADVARVAAEEAEAVAKVEAAALTEALAKVEAEAAAEALAKVEAAAAQEYEAAREILAAEEAAAEKAEADEAAVLARPRGREERVAAVGFGDAAPRPERVLAIALTRRPLFPGMVHSLTISRAAADALIAERDAGRPYLALFLRRDNNDSAAAELLDEIAVASRSENGDAMAAARGAIYSTGVFAQLHTVQPMADGHSQALCLVHRRVDLNSVVDVGPPPRFGVTHWAKEVWESPTPRRSSAGPSRMPTSRTTGRRKAPSAQSFDKGPDPMDVLRALSNEVVAVIRELVQLNPLYREHMQYFTQRVDIADPFKLADFAASLATADGAELQHFLEERDVEKRLRMALDLVSKERELSRLQAEIAQQVELKISTQQRQFLLNEQLKTIKKELGVETDDKDALLTRYRERVARMEKGLHEDEPEAAADPDSKSLIPKRAKMAIDEEIAKLASLEKNSSEFNVTKNYLDWLTILPWGRHSVEKFDIHAAKEVLDKQHHGMDDVKERILELVAVGNLVGEVRGKILCLVGPPGVGKTSIGMSIANALGREYYRFSVGGLTDVAEIKGHRRTYVGAMPGKPVQCLKVTKTSNPLILIDEVDKIGRPGHGGDPSSALLELLDPAQNRNFMDHYLDVPVDLSRCLFICTANVEHTIPAPLLDRMEVVRLAGYDLTEKVQIAKNYLVPIAIKEAGLEPDKTTIDDDALTELIRGYAREAGVRSLQKLVEKITRKLALKVVRGRPDAAAPQGDVVVTPAGLVELVGQPKFSSDRLYASDVPCGVVMGLAWTSMGGSTLFIEATNLAHDDDAVVDDSKEDSKEEEKEEKKDSPAKRRPPPKLTVTGQLGSVMEESSRVAMAHVRSRLAKLTGEEKTSLDGHEIHVHVPEGATPKDGPSAGVTIATALLSLARRQPVRTDLAMTGELSLTGKVLPIGGVKEKTIAARRAGVTHIMFPAENKHDFEELPDYLKQGLTAHYADTFDDVVNVAFQQTGTA